MKLYSLYENILCKIEAALDDDLTTEKLANELFISSSHLQRLFKSAFNTSLANYIRSRKLAASLDKLMNSPMSILDIALHYGFEHAQSYIRAFKNEFDITPGELRKTKQIVRIKPPLQMLSLNILSDGVLFGPEIVYIPELLCVGKKHNIPYGCSADVPAKAGRDFWLKEKGQIANILDECIYIGLTKFPLLENVDYTEYIPSVCVTDFSQVPADFVSNKIPSCLGARFHYIGEHHYLDINADIAKEMYNAIDKFDDSSSYLLYKYGLQFEKIDIRDYDGRYCKMEWFSPIEKND